MLIGPKFYNRTPTYPNFTSVQNYSGPRKLRALLTELSIDVFPSAMYAFEVEFNLQVIASPGDTPWDNRPRRPTS